MLRRVRLPITDAAPLFERVGLMDVVLLGHPTVVATHDGTMADVAAHLRMTVTDPVLTT